jgi:hypothetical protein
MDIELNEVQKMLQQTRKLIVVGAPRMEILKTLDEALEIVEIVNAVVMLNDDEFFGGGQTS